MKSQRAHTIYQKIRSKLSMEKLAGILQQKDRVLALVKNSPKLNGFVEDIQLFISLIRDYLNKSYTEIPKNTILAVGAALAYLLLPFDAIADFIPLLGFIDDAAIIAYCINLVGKDLEKYREWKEKDSQALKEVG